MVVGGRCEKGASCAGGEIYVKKDFWRGADIEVMTSFLLSCLPFSACESGRCSAIHIDVYVCNVNVYVCAYVYTCFW